MFWLFLAPAGFPDREDLPVSREDLAFPVSESLSESESTCSRAKREAVVGTEIKADAMVEQLEGLCSGLDLK